MSAHQGIRLRIAAPWNSTVLGSQNRYQGNQFRMSNLFLNANETQSARVEQDWGNLTWLASREIGNVEDVTLGRVVIRRGHSNPRHAHPSCEEVLYLLAGKLDHSLGDETFRLEAGDTLSVPAGVFHNAVSIGEVDADMIVVYSTGTRDFVKESAQS